MEHVTLSVPWHARVPVSSPFCWFSHGRSHILKVYLSNVRSVLEYAAQVWQDIPAYLSDAIESIQRRPLRVIIFPNCSYQQVQDLTNLSTLANRWILLCKKLMADMRDKSHPISFMAPKVTTRTMPYQLDQETLQLQKL